MFNKHCHLFSTCFWVYIYIYIYTEREREREREQLNTTEEVRTNSKVAFFYTPVEAPGLANKPRLTYISSLRTLDAV